jgi:hypothetical protein
MEMWETYKAGEPTDPMQLWNEDRTKFWREMLKRWYVGPRAMREGDHVGGSEELEVVTGCECECFLQFAARIIFFLFSYGCPITTGRSSSLPMLSQG